MKKVIALSAIFLLFFPLVSLVENDAVTEEKESELTWYTDLDEVHKISKETGKPIFGFFTGSDWCGWCMKLQHDVFKKEAFIKWANEKVILLELDFPKRTEQSPELKKQNQGLQQAFKVTGYPTVWLFNTDKDPETAQFHLTALGKLGYPRGAEKGKEEVKFINDANSFLDAQTKEGK
ncbi:MAG: thioredoxin family protein [Flavobacteriales bacterium]|jgi:protein disulfide-isomerase|nr:thioredoxin family protein [Flavobacteriales bacterium]